MPVDLIDGNTYKAPKGSKQSSPISLKPLTNTLLLLLYSAAISLTLSSPFLSASIAAYCAVVGEHIIPYWWIFFIASIKILFPAAYPSLHPVIAYALENPFTINVLSLTSLNNAIETCSSS